MKTILFALATAALGLFAGCKTHHDHGAYAPASTMKGDLENREKFVLMDKRAQYSVTCMGLQEQVRDDGRLEVAAQIRNRENRRIQVQVDCVFKDMQGFTVEQTPFQTLILGENSQENVRFVSMNDKARNYTFRVREAR